MGNIKTYTETTLPTYLSKIVETVLIPFTENNKREDIRNINLTINFDELKKTNTIGFLTFTCDILTIHVKIIRETDNVNESLEITNYPNITNVAILNAFEITDTLRFIVKIGK